MFFLTQQALNPSLIYAAYQSWHLGQFSTRKPHTVSFDEHKKVPCSLVEKSVKYQNRSKSSFLVESKYVNLSEYKIKLVKYRKTQMNVSVFRGFDIEIKFFNKA